MEEVPSGYFCSFTLELVRIWSLMKNHYVRRKKVCCNSLSKAHADRRNCYPFNNLAIKLHTGTSVSFIFFAQDGSFALKDKELCYHIVYFILFPSFTFFQRRLEVLLDTCQKRAHLLQHRLLVSPLRPSSVACISRELKHSN